MTPGEIPCELPPVALFVPSPFPPLPPFPELPPVPTVGVKVPETVVVPLAPFPLDKGLPEPDVDVPPEDPPDEPPDEFPVPSLGLESATLIVPPFADPLFVVPLPLPLPEEVSPLPVVLPVPVPPEVAPDPVPEPPDPEPEPDVEEGEDEPVPPDPVDPPELPPLFEGVPDESLPPPPLSDPPLPDEEPVEPVEPPDEFPLPLPLLPPSPLLFPLLPLPPPLFPFPLLPPLPVLVVGDDGFADVVVDFALLLTPTVMPRTSAETETGRPGKFSPSPRGSGSRSCRSLLLFLCIRKECGTAAIAVFRVSRDQSQLLSEMFLDDLSLCVASQDCFR